MTREQYRAHPALNFSLAKHLLKSPAHFKAAEEAQEDEDREETEAQRIGTIAHALVLEGKDLGEMYAIKPEGMSFVTKEGKAWKAAQDKPIIEEKAIKGIRSIAEAIAKNPAAAAILRGCPERERPIFATMHGVACKALLDAAGTDGTLWAISDFKTTTDASPRKFSRSVFDMDYDMQCVWYSDLLARAEGLEEPPWYAWIAAEKKAPWLNVVYHPSEDMIESGRRKVVRALQIYKECTASGEWPLPFPGVNTLELPSYVKLPPEEQTAEGKEVAA
jgi:hypothetical protein